MALLDAVFADRPGMTPQDVERQRRLAQALLAENSGVEPLQHPLQAVAKIMQSGVGAWKEHKASKGEAAGRKARADALGRMLTGGTTPASTSPSLPSDLGGSPATSTAMATMPAPNSGDLRGGIISTATALGIAPEDLATAISYETAGTFDPTKRGPTTQWGQHRGLIQFGEPQAKQYGVNWDDPLGSQLGPDGAIAKYLRDTGVKPGMGLLDIYSAINAGGVGRYNRSDANNGGAPGTVRDKVEKQMAGHRQKALALLGMNGQTQAPAVAALDALAGGKAAPPSITDAEAKEILARPRPADAQPYSGPGSIIDPAGVAQLEQTRLEQERASRYAAMPGWMQEMIPQSAAPLSDDQFAARFATTGGPAPEMRDGTQMPGAQEFIAERMAGFAPPQATNPQQQMLAQALTGATLADDRIPMAGGQLGFAPIQQMPPVSQLPQQQAMAQALTGGQQAQPAPGISPQMIQELLGNPWTEDIGQQLLGKYLDQQEKERLRLLEQQEAERQMQRRLDAAAAAGVDPRFIGDDDIWKQATGAQFREQPTDIREYEYARRQGYQGTFAEFQIEQKRAGATNVDARNMGTIPQGYRMIYDDAGNPIQMEPIPGGPADTSSEEETAANNRQVSTDIITNAAKLARQALTGPGLPATGTMGRVLSALPETNASEVRRHVETLQAQAKIENLQAMRAASPTGGALGAVSDKENAMLAAKSGALDPDSPTFARDLDDYERTLLRIVHGPQAGDAIFEQTREAAPSKPLSEMTDEELEAIINGQ